MERIPDRAGCDEGRLAPATCGVLVAALAVAPVTAPASTTFDIRGKWQVAAQGGAPQSNTYDTIDLSSGRFTGHGAGDPPLQSVTWSVSGTVTGNQITQTVVYTGGGYTATLTGTIAPDGNHMSGTFNDSAGHNGFTWSATRVSGRPREASPGQGGDRRAGGWAGVGEAAGSGVRAAGRGTAGPGRVAARHDSRDGPARERGELARGGPDGRLRRRCVPGRPVAQWGRADRSEPEWRELQRLRGGSGHAGGGGPLEPCGPAAAWPGPRPFPHPRPLQRGDGARHHLDAIDRCDGTLTKVTRGVVVVRDLRKRRNITVRAGKSYLARAP